jgi:tripartite-type tricarboxylate transporter receptor subunit TctC
MIMSIRNIAAAFGLAVAFAFAGSGGAAADYPERSITLVVPFGAGGTNDIVGRIVAEALGERLGQPIVIDNRPGAGGRVGTLHASQQAPDGYTLTMSSSGTNAIGPIVQPDIGYDPLTDFTYVTLIAETPYVLAVINDSEFETLDDLLAAARDRPGELNFGTAGVGSATHLAAELFLDISGVEMEHIPYGGSGPASAALLGQEVDFIFSSFPGVISHIQSGEARLLGVGTLARVPQVPDVPTMHEQGLEGYEATLWITIAGPAGMPDEVVERLFSEITDIIENDETVRQRLVENGASPLSSESPESVLELVRATQDLWRPIIERTIEN